MIPVLLMAALLAGFEIYLQVVLPVEEQPGVDSPGPDEDESDLLPFGPIPRKND